MKKNQTVRIQSAKMIILTFVHFLADSVGNFIPGFLPAIIAYFHLNLATGVMIGSFMGIFCNLLQIPASKLGEKSKSPFWLILGIFLIGSTCLIGLLPPGTPLPVILLLIFSSAVGIALAHPTGLRGTQALNALPSGIVTTFFMTGGFFGAAFAPWCSSLLVEQFGLKGVLFFLPLILLIALSVKIFGIVLETGRKKQVRKGDLVSPWSFESLLLISTFLNCGSAVFSGLVVYMLNVEKGFSMSYGGFALMLFGVGSSVFSVILGIISSRRKVDSLILLLLFCGIPVTLCFFLFSQFRPAILLAFACGALCSSPFPLFVSMSKNAPGKYSPGIRMGMIVGGTWGIAGLVFLAVGILAEHFGTCRILTITVPVFYTLAAVFAVISRKRFEKKVEKA